MTLTKKFGVDARRGHALLATLLSRQPPTRVNEHATLELAHHLLKARMFRGKSKTTGNLLCINYYYTRLETSGFQPTQKVFT